MIWRCRQVAFRLLLVLASYGCATPRDVVLGNYRGDAGTKSVVPTQTGTNSTPSATVDASRSDDLTNPLPANHDHDDSVRRDGATGTLSDSGLPTSASHSDDIDAARH